MYIRVENEEGTDHSRKEEEIRLGGQKAYLVVNEQNILEEQRALSGKAREKQWVGRLKEIVFGKL